MKYVGTVLFLLRSKEPEGESCTTAIPVGIYLTVGVFGYQEVLKALLSLIKAHSEIRVIFRESRPLSGNNQMKCDVAIGLL